jgi:hypothetical protein
MMGGGWVRKRAAMWLWSLRSERAGDDGRRVGEKKGSNVIVELEIRKGRWWWEEGGWEKGQQCDFGAWGQTLPKPPIPPTHRAMESKTVAVDEKFQAEFGEEFNLIVSSASSGHEFIRILSSSSSGAEFSTLSWPRWTTSKPSL